MVAAWHHALRMLILAFGIWRLKRYALWMLLAYTQYVLLNLVLFSSRYELHPPGGIPVPVFQAICATIALGVPGGTAWLLNRRRPELT